MVACHHFSHLLSGMSHFGEYYVGGHIPKDTVFSGIKYFPYFSFSVFFQIREGKLSSMP